MARVDPDPLRLEGETLQFMQRVWNLAHSLEVVSKRMARTLGVTGPQRLVLRVLGQTPSATAGDLAATLQMHPSTLTGILKRLESQKLIERTIDPGDRRRSHIVLSAKGKRIDRARKGTVEAAVRRALLRASEQTVAETVTMLELVTTELLREAPEDG